MKSKILSAAVGILAAASLAAQKSQIEGRQYHAALAQLPGSIGSLTGLSGGGASLATLKWVDIEAGGPYALSLPFERMGAIVPLDASNALVCGSTETLQATTGYLCQVAISPTQLRLTEVIMLPGVDPYAMAWNSRTSSLAIFDGVTRSLLVARYAGSSSVLPSAGLFAVAAVPAQAVPLGGIDVKLRSKDLGFRVRAHSLAPEGELAPVGTTWNFTPKPAVLIDVTWVTRFR